MSILYQDSPSLFETIKRIFPEGTRGSLLEDASKPKSSSTHWSSAPQWPPDLFAVSAYIVDRFDGYINLLEDDSVVNQDDVDKCKKIGEKWREIGIVGGKDTYEDWSKNYQPELKKIWKKFLALTKKYYLNKINAPCLTNELNAHAIKLLIISDEACLGIGFDVPHEQDKERTWVMHLHQLITYSYPDRSDIQEKVSRVVKQQNDELWAFDATEALIKIIDGLDEYDNLEDSENPDEYMAPHREKLSLCIMANQHELCVQPKTKVPITGCTLRSLSHNVALLPPTPKVSVNWNSHTPVSKEDSAFNILAIPYPFFIDGASFYQENVVEGNLINGTDKTGLFSIDQKWLREIVKKKKSSTNEDSKDLTYKELQKLVCNLLSEAKKHVRKVDLIIFPELALDFDFYQRLSDYLALENKRKKDDYISVLISGVLHEKNNKKYNCAFTSIIDQNTNGSEDMREENEGGNRDTTTTKAQYKHHRWLLEKNQISQYSLGDALDPSMNWWESTPIENRALNFMPFRKGACFTTLICEDLARLDPCHDIVRAIGPNIVFALLMDGAQVRGRWPERYAMGLSDDPGSSVFTLTSLGLVRRANYHHKSKVYNIGLWRDPLTGTKELDIPAGNQGLMMTLNLHRRKQVTMDGRSSEDNTDQIWALSGVVPLRIEDSKLKI